jgi:hypothetical protein
MPEHGLLREAAAWVVDLAVFCDVVRPALFRIAEFVVSVVGLVAVVWLALRRRGV